jgi:hypothetical protein
MFFSKENKFKNVDQKMEKKNKFDLLRKKREKCENKSHLKNSSKSPEKQIEV